MQATDRYFTNLPTLQIDAVQTEKDSLIHTQSESVKTKLTALDEMVSSIDPIGSVQFELFVSVSPV